MTTNIFTVKVKVRSKVYRYELSVIMNKKTVYNHSR